MAMTVIIRSQNTLLQTWNSASFLLGNWADPQKWSERCLWRRKNYRQGLFCWKVNYSYASNTDLKKDLSVAFSLLDKCRDLKHCTNCRRICENANQEQPAAAKNYAFPPTVCSWKECRKSATRSFQMYSDPNQTARKYIKIARVMNIPAGQEISKWK